jgi:hypothetical protein
MAQYRPILQWLASHDARWRDRAISSHDRLALPRRSPLMGLAELSLLVPASEALSVPRLYPPRWNGSLTSRRQQGPLLVVPSFHAHGSGRESIGTRPLKTTFDPR